MSIFHARHNFSRRIPLLAVLLGLPWVLLALTAAFWPKLASAYPSIKACYPQLRIGILVLCAASLLVVIVGLFAVAFREDPDSRRF